MGRGECRQLPQGLAGVRGVRAGPGRRTAFVCAIAVALGWMAGLPVLQGAYFGLPPATAWTAILLGLLGAALILSRPGQGGRAHHGRVGRSVAALATVGAATVLLDEVCGCLFFDWAAQGAWQQPISGPVFMLLPLPFSVLTVDTGPPGYRWNDFLIPLIAVRCWSACWLSATGWILLSDGWTPASA